MKKLTALICAIIMMVLTVPAVPAAETALDVSRPEGGMLVKGEIEDECPFEPSYRTVYAAGDMTEQVYELMYEGMKNHDQYIDLSGLSVPYTAFNTVVMKAFEKTLYYHPELLIYPLCWGYRDSKYNPEYIVGVEPCYIFEADETEEAAAARKVIEDGIDYYVKLADGVDDTVGKLLVIHDEFAKKNAYATEELDAYQEKVKNGTDTDEDMIIFTGYGLFKNNRAVCQGNSIAMAAIYNKLGVETGFCQSDAINHIWNLVKLDGKWYQLDETWNDADVQIGKDADGNRILADKTYHDYFLVTDKTMSDHGSSSYWEYHTNSGAVTCTDATYETGNIFNGDYIYGGYNYGTWYGNISYDKENKRYVIDVFARPAYNESTGQVVLTATGFKEFYSDFIHTGGFIATEPIATTTGTAVILFAVENTKYFTDCYYAVYDGDAMASCDNIRTFYPVAGTSAAVVSVKGTGGKLFFWQRGTSQPMCEAREIN